MGHLHQDTGKYGLFQYLSMSPAGRPEFLRCAAAMLQEVAGWTALLYERKMRRQNVISSPCMEQSYREAEVEFAVSAIETAAAKAGVTGDVIYQALAAEDGIREFLLPSFEALNRESIDRIADEVLLWLRSRNTSLTRKI